MQPLFVDVDVKALFQRKGKRGNSMVQGHGRHRKHGIFEDRKKTGALINGERTRDRTRREKTVGGVERHLPDFFSVEFANLNGQRIPVDEVPRVATQFPVHILYQPRRTVEAKRFAAAKRHPYDGIEADEVVHVGVGNEEVIGPQQASGPERIIMSEVEEQRPLGPADFHIDAGIAEAVVDEVAGK